MAVILSVMRAIKADISSPRSIYPFGGTQTTSLREVSFSELSALSILNGKSSVDARVDVVIPACYT